MRLEAFAVFVSVKGGEGVPADSGDPATEIYRVVCFVHGPCPDPIDLHNERDVGLKQLILILCNIFFLLSFSSKFY